MNQTEHLLAGLAEEGSEVTKDAIKPTRSFWQFQPPPDPKLTELVQEAIARLVTLHDFEVAVHDAIHKILNKNGPPPQALYLGREQGVKLRLVTINLAYCCDPAYNGKRREFMGLQIFVVDADNHFAVA